MRLAVPWFLGAISLFSLLGGCGHPPLEPRDPTPGVPHFRVGSYNVELTDSGDRSTIEAVEAVGSEILCLQEITGAWETILREKLGDRYPHMLFKSEDGAGGLAVLSEYPLTDLGLRPGPRGWHPAWHVLAESPVGPVQILNVHLRPVFTGRGDPVSSYLSVDDDHRAQIDTFTSDCDTDTPSLVVGDFNEGPDGDAVRFLESAGYRNTLPLFRPGQETWRLRSLGGQTGETMDHILFDSNFVPLDSWVLVRGNSDHLPVVAHFESAHHW